VARIAGALPTPQGFYRTGRLDADAFAVCRPYDGKLRTHEGASLAAMASRSDDPEALVATELAELEALAAGLPADEVEGVPPVQGPQDWE
jgi:hypothetical protein